MFEEVLNTPLLKAGVRCAKRPLDTATWSVNLRDIRFEIDLNWFKNETFLTLEAISETYSEPCQISKMEVFAKIVNGFSFLTIFTKNSILDVWHNSEFPSEDSNDL